jgi:hypothetical protein
MLLNLHQYQKFFVLLAYGNKVYLSLKINIIKFLVGLGDRLTQPTIF